MKRHKVLVMGHIDESGRNRLLADGRFALEMLPDHDPARFAAAADADMVIVRMTRIDSEFLSAAPGLRFVARHGVGHDTVDKPALAARGIPLAIIGDVNSGAVAEHTMALMLACAKRVIDYDRALRTGDFAIRDSFSAGELEGRVLLLVGSGRIGRKVARMAHGFGMEVVVFDPFLAEPPPGAVLVKTLAEGLARADYVSLHAPKTAETTHIIDAQALASLKPGGTVINVSRGGLVDEAALCAALRSGHLRAAALDVFETEPPAPDDPVLSCPGIVLSPHAAAFTADCAARMSMACAENVMAFAEGRLDPALVVNADMLKPVGASGVGR